MAQKITYDTVHEALVAAVQDRGADWVYPEAMVKTDQYGYDVVTDKWHDDEGNCVFARTNGEPACIVGYALDYLGYDIADMPNGGADDAIGWVTDYDTRFQYRAGEDWPLVEALNAAQTAQDVRKPWGEALDKFEERYARLSAQQKKEEN